MSDKDEKPVIYDKDKQCTITVFAVNYNIRRICGDIDENGNGSGSAGLMYSN
jgi:hypothetical protein